jgi:hypothetical protein
MMSHELTTLPARALLAAEVATPEARLKTTGTFDGELHQRVCLNTIICIFLSPKSKHSLTQIEHAPFRRPNSS